MTPEDIVGSLKKLIETSKDGELGYRTAAEHVHNTQLQSVFRDYAKQRAQFAQQLVAEVERRGGTAGDSGSLAAALHRGWIDVKAALSGGAGGPIVAACESGEEAASAAYQGVLDLDISGETRTMIERQFRHVQDAHQHMLRLKEGNATAADYPKIEVSKGGSSN